MHTYMQASAAGLMAVAAYSMAARADDPATTTPKVLSGHPCMRQSAYVGTSGTPLTGDSATELSFTVTVDGTVKDVAIVSSSGNSTLDETAISCVSSWKYRPAAKDGVAVEVPWKTVVSWRMGRPR